jgi:flagellar biosynthesis protein FliQ
MNEADAIDLIRSALWTVVLASGPPVLAAMIVGIIIALFQALTQIQEMTLTFVPKMIAIFAVIIMAGPFIGGQVLLFSERSYLRVESGFERALVRPSDGSGGRPGSASGLRSGFAPMDFVGSIPGS